MPPPDARTPSASPGRTGADSSLPEWVGEWRVTSWNGDAPDAPTYYAATLESWDVITHAAGADPYVAPHPILEAGTRRIVLKDEGEPDENAERWQAEVEGDVLRVTALTGPHAGAVGVAEHIETIPRDPDPGLDEAAP